MDGDDVSNEKVGSVSSAELARLLYETYLKWNDNGQFRNFTEQRVPLSVIDEIGLGAFRKHAHAFYSEAMSRLPIRINESSYEWLCNHGRGKTIGDLKKVSICGGYWRVYNRECSPWAYERRWLLDPEEFKKNVTYVIDFDRVRFDLDRNVLLGCLPPGFVRRIFGWSQLEYATATIAIYGGFPTLHEEGRIRRSRTIAAEGRGNVTYEGECMINVDGRICRDFTLPYSEISSQGAYDEVAGKRGIVRPELKRGKFNDATRLDDIG